MKDIFSYVFTLKERGDNMNKKIWGTIVGLSMGMVVASKLTPENRRRMMKKTKKTTSSIMNGIGDMWS